LVADGPSEKRASQRAEPLPRDVQRLITGRGGFSRIGSTTYFEYEIYNGSAWTVTSLLFRIQTVQRSDNILPPRAYAEELYGGLGPYQRISGRFAVLSESGDVTNAKPRWWVVGGIGYRPPSEFPFGSNIDWEALDRQVASDNIDWEALDRQVAADEAERLKKAKQGDEATTPPRGNSDWDALKRDMNARGEAEKGLQIEVAPKP